MNTAVVGFQNVGMAIVAPTSAPRILDEPVWRIVAIEQHNVVDLVVGWTIVDESTRTCILEAVATTRYSYL